MNFVSIDFETANHSRVSICAAGMAVFENGDSIVNRLGNCLLLTKGHNISKSEGSIMNHFKKYFSEPEARAFLTALQMPVELAEPREALAKFDLKERIPQLIKAIDDRETLMKKSFLAFARDSAFGAAL